MTTSQSARSSLLRTNRKSSRCSAVVTDAAIALDGSYYLTYHRYATREQVQACHPRFAEFLAMKARYDPDEIFTSDWYRSYKAMFQ